MLCVVLNSLVTLNMSKPSNSDAVSLTELSKYTQKTDHLSGLAGWNVMPEAFTNAMLSDPVPDFVDTPTGRFDLGHAISTTFSIPLTGVMCILIAMLIFFSVPFDAIATWREITKLSDEQKEKQRLKEEAEAEELIKKGQKPVIKKVDDEEPEKLSIYGKDQVIFGWLILVISIMISLTSIVYGLAGNSIAGLAAQKLSGISEEVVAGTEMGVANMSQWLQTRYSRSGLGPVADAISGITRRSDFFVRSFTSLDGIETQLQTILGELQSEVDLYREAINNISSLVTAAKTAGKKISDMSSAEMLSGYIGNVRSCRPTLGNKGIRNLAPFIGLTHDFSDSDSTSTVGNMYKFDPQNVIGFSTFYQQQNDAITTASNNFWNAFYGNVIATTANNMRTFAGRTDSATKSGLKWLQLTFNSAKGSAREFTASFERANGQRSMTTYVVLTLVFLLMAISTSALLFGKMKVARAVNFFNRIFLGIIWVLCAVTIGYAVLSTGYCREASGYKFQHWAPKLQRSLELSSIVYMNVSRNVEDMYKTRDYCYNGISTQFFSQALNLASSYRLDMFEINNLQVLGDGYATASTFIADAVAWMDPNGDGYRNEVTSWANAIAGIFQATYRGGALTNRRAFRSLINVPLKSLLSAAQTPTFHQETVYEDTRAALNAFGNSFATEDFAASPPSTNNECPANYRTIFLPGFINDYITYLTTNATIIQDAKDQLVPLLKKAITIQNRIRELQFNHDRIIDMRSISNFAGRYGSPLAIANVSP